MKVDKWPRYLGHLSSYVLCAEGCISMNSKTLQKQELFESDNQHGGKKISTNYGKYSQNVKNNPKKCCLSVKNKEKISFDFKEQINFEKSMEINKRATVSRSIDYSNNKMNNNKNTYLNHRLQILKRKIKKSILNKK